MRFTTEQGDRARRWRRACVATVTALIAGLTLGVGPSPAAAQAPPGFIDPVPETDPFYLPPQDLANYQPGDIVRSRQVTAAALGVLPLRVDAWQVVFRSNDVQGNPQVGLTTVLVPHNAAPAGGRPLVAYQMAEDSLATHCAPSRQLLAGSRPSNTTVQSELMIVLAMLQQGSTVTVTDHEGPNSAYPSGPQAAHHTLDAIRATQRFQLSQVNGPATRVGLMGYSGGAVASGWAAEVAPTYAPELNIVGVAQGGVPIDLLNLVEVGSGNLASGFGLAGIIGIARAHPDFMQFLQDHVTQTGVDKLSPLRDACLNEILIKGMNVDVNTLSDVPDVLNHPMVQDVMAREMRGQAMPTAPQYVYHSTGDVLPIAAVDDLVGKYCAAGLSVKYHRDTSSNIGPGVLPGGGAHGILAVTGAPAAVQWMNQRLSGQPAAPGCDIQTKATSLLDPGVLGSINTYLHGLVSMFGSVPKPAGVFQNGGFEDGGMSPWSCTRNCGIDQGAGLARTGTGNGWVRNWYGWNDINQRIAVLPNTRYELSGWVRTSSNNRNAYFGLRATSGAVLGEQRLTPSGTYTRVAVTVNSGSNHTLDLYAGLWATGDTWLQLDDVTLQRVP